MALLAALLGAALVVGVDRALPGLFNLQVIPFEVPLGTLTPEPPEDTVLAQLIVVHLLVAVAGGAVAALIAPQGRKLLAAAGVAFLGSLGAGYTGVFLPVGPDWYHGLHFATVLIGPCIGGNLLLRGRAEPEPEPIPLAVPVAEAAREPAAEAAEEPEAEPDVKPARADEDEDEDERGLDGVGPVPEPA
jgi:hypothetical protein